MYQLYQVLYSHSHNGIQPSPEEVLYASGKMPFDSLIHTEYINNSLLKQPVSKKLSPDSKQRLLCV